MMTHVCQELLEEWELMAAESRACGYEYPSFQEWLGNMKGFDVSKMRAEERIKQKEWWDE